MTHEKPVARSTILCSYVLAFLIPFAGFFAGIYLVLKKEHGHGVTVIALSVLGLSVLAYVIHYYWEFWQQIKSPGF